MPKKDFTNNMAIVRSFMVRLKIAKRKGENINIRRRRK